MASNEKKGYSSEPIVSSDGDSYLLYTFSGDDTLEVRKFESKGSAESVKREYKELTPAQKRIVADILNEESEGMLGLMESLVPAQKGEVDFVPDELNPLAEKLEEYEQEFTETKDKYDQLAKTALLKLVDFYFENEMIDEDSWVKMRLQMEGMGLSMILFQLDASHKAIFKLSQEIHVNPITVPRNYEVLQQLQRVTLDTATYLNKLLTELEKNVKGLKEDLLEMKFENGADEEEELVFVKKTKLLQEIKEYTSEVKQYVRPKSKNPKLRQEEYMPKGVEFAEDAVEVDPALEESSTSARDESMPTVSEITGKTGFETFDPDDTDK